MTPIVPTSDTSNASVYIGLIEQYHYVALEAITESTDSVDSTDDNSTEELSDDIIEQGDEHTRQITGGPLDTMLSHKNLSANAHYVYSVALAEGHTPIFIMSIIHFE